MTAIQDAARSESNTGNMGTKSIYHPVLMLSGRRVNRISSWSVSVSDNLIELPALAGGGAVMPRGSLLASINTDMLRFDRL